ncbi:hypothetical protein EUGRSUZ_E02281 [Eucalyptus grandis]|uniref:Uncharacterized protein n=2 Tax=Eucalyptus grandis TaxID=71139 RepID=A0ACC3KZ36_EUCGR|nr:hypothetical protein EUGRSUZ_E02281 [Eucalyptus grandis]
MEFGSDLHEQEREGSSRLYHDERIADSFDRINLLKFHIIWFALCFWPSTEGPSMSVHYRNSPLSWSVSTHVILILKVFDSNFHNLWRRDPPCPTHI